MSLWLPPIVQMAIIFAFSSIPDLGAVPGGVSDKSGHAIGYGILGVLLLRAFAGGRVAGISWKSSLLAIAAATAYGLTDELHQAFVPGRSPEALDVAADFAGAAVAVGVTAAITAWGILGFSSSREDADRGSKVRK